MNLKPEFKKKVLFISTIVNYGSHQIELDPDLNRYEQI